MNERKKISYRISQVICWISFIGYLGVLWQLVINKGMHPWGRELSLKPFSFLIDYIKHGTDLSLMLKNALGNLGVFVPLGILVPALFQKLNVRKTILIGFLTSLFIEIFQYVLNIGIADIDDLILNTAGVCVGAVIYFGITRRLDKKFGNLFGTILFIAVIGLACLYILWFFGYMGNLISRPTRIENEEILDGLLEEDSDYNLLLTDTSSLKKDILTGENYIYNESTEENSTETVSLNLIDSTQYYSCTIDNEYTPNGNIRRTTTTYDELSLEEFIELAGSQTDSTWIDIWLDTQDSCKDVLITVDK